MGKQRRQFTEEFKRDAVRMMRGRGSRTVADVADDLGVSQNLLHRWAQKFDQDAVAKRNADPHERRQPTRNHGDILELDRVGVGVISVRESWLDREAMSATCSS